MIAVLLITALGLASCRTITTKPEKHFAIEIGQSYEENVPLLFKQFQHTVLQDLKRDTPFHEQSVC